MFIVFSPSEAFRKRYRICRLHFLLPLCQPTRPLELGKSLKPILPAIRLSRCRLMVPRVLPAQQYRTCTGVSASLCQIEFEVGLLAPGLWSSRTVLLCAVHQLRLNVSSCSSVNWALGTRAYEEPHARAQACRAEAVERRHMWPKVGGKALGGLRGHRGRSINLSMGGQLAGLKGVCCESEVAGSSRSK